MQRMSSGDVQISADIFNENALGLSVIEGS